MRLALSGAQLRLPTIMKFASLTDLSLERIWVAAGGSELLSRLVSSATCPLLQKLRMRRIYLPGFCYEEMRIEAEVLSELWMEDVGVLMSLKLRTPRLRVLHIYIQVLPRGAQDLSSEAGRNCNLLSTTSIPA